MTFRLRIFLAIFMTSTLLLASAGIITHRFVSKNIHQNFLDRYVSIANVTADTLRGLESSTDQMMRNALVATKVTLDQSSKIPSSVELQKIRDRLGLGSIDYVLPSGEMYESSDFAKSRPTTPLNFFNFCSKYIDLFTGRRDSDFTGLLPSSLTGKITKYAQLSGKDRKYLINVGYEARFIGEALTATLESDHNIKRIGLSAPNGTSLGEFSKSFSLNTNHDSESGEILSAGAHKIKILEDYLQIESIVTTNAEDCCECVVKKLTEPGSTRFFYRLKTLVSRSELKIVLDHTRNVLRIVIFAGVVLSFFFASFLSRWLVRSLTRVRDTTSEIMRRGDMTARLNFGAGKDEVSQLAAQTDQMLDSLERAQMSILEKGKFEAIANMTQVLAHDVRKPFSILRMGLALLNSAKDPESVKGILAKMVPEIDEAVSSVDGLISDVMEVGSTTTNLIFETVSPDTIINSSFSEVFKIYSKSDISITYEFRHEHMLQVHTHKVIRIFTNILSNGVQAMSYRGRFWIRTREMAGMIEFCIGNASSYILPENISKLFDAFYTSGKKGGTGLGLAIAQKMVQAHGGRIWCESVRNAQFPEGKTEFYFTLPAAQKIDHRTAIKLLKHSRNYTGAGFTATESSGLGSVDPSEYALEGEIVQESRLLIRPLRILIVDDEDIYRNALASYLVRTPELVSAVEVHHAESSQKALKCVESNMFDLILTDVDMGEQSQDGFELVSELRKVRSVSTFICVHSNRIVAADHQTALENGADAFLPKPMARAQFLRLILLSSKRTHLSPTLTKEKSMKTRSKPFAIVIDDSSFILDAWQDIFKDEVDVRIAASFEELESLFKSEPDLVSQIDFVITDLYFDNSNKNGIDIGRMLKSRRPDLPVMLSTDGFVTDSESAGAFDFVISKIPVPYKELPIQTV